MQIQSKLNTYHLKTKPDIDQAVKTVLKQYKCRKWIDCKIYSHRQYKTSHGKKGRPKLGEKGEVTWSKYFTMSFDINQEVLEQEALTDGVFLFITNVDEKKCGPKRVLEIYKFQAFLETRHSQLKTWQEVTPVLLKKSERIVAFLHIHVIALMVSSLIERQLRSEMKRKKILLPIYPETRKCPYPTMMDIARLFREVEKYEVEQNGKVTVFPAQLNKYQKQVLKLLEVPMSLYQ